MQFIEKNSFNVRSAVYRLISDKEMYEFILFPMIHVGSKQYYDEIRKRIMECDLILAEGLKSKKIAFMTLSYRVVKKIKRMDLVIQEDALKFSELPVKIINSDLSGQIFDRGWSALPLSLRAQFVVMIPFMVIYMFFFGTRKFIADRLSLDDLPSREELLYSDEETDEYIALIIDERDKHLISVIENVLNQKAVDRKRIGILYGARHMRNVVLYLQNKRGYRIAQAEWVTVFDL